MGNNSSYIDDFMDKTIKVIKWAGNIIYSVVSWFIGQIRDIVENTVKKFIQACKAKLLGAQNFADTLKTAVITKMLKVLVEIQDQFYKKLSPNDKSIIDDIFAKDNTCPI
jgi:hypothetical protein